MSRIKNDYPKKVVIREVYSLVRGLRMKELMNENFRVRAVLVVVCFAIQTSEDQ